MDENRTPNWDDRATHWMPLPAPPRPGDRTDSGEAQDGSLNQTSINAVPKPEGE